MVESIAVIGMAGRFPEAMDLSQFWHNLVEGRDCIAHLDVDDLRERGESPSYLSHPDYVLRRPCMPAYDMFDARCFGMTPREAEIRDPQQRVFLEISHSALEQAGYDPARFAGRVGVFAGTNVQRYRIDHLEQVPEINQTVGFIALEISNAPDYVATFVAHRLGLTGPAMTIQTACSTSLTAVHTAAQSLRAGDCDMALAGVSSIEFPVDYGYIYLDGSILAKDGMPRPFDAEADGTNFGSGAGVVLLKRLSDAVRDRDTILAVVRGSAINNDGDRKAGFTAPSIPGQAEAIADALRQSGVHPSQISYVEAHGTGTRVGDPIEVSGLVEAFRRAAGEEALPAQYCGLGSVKGNIGHMGQAAGASGFIKTVLALANEQVPPSIHMTTLNPRLQLAETPFYVNTELRPWPRTAGEPRRAGVSSFGIGGTNGHAVLEEAPEPERVDWTPRDAELIVWSGADKAAVEAYAETLAGHLAELDRTAFADTAFTLRVGRRERRFRAAVVAADGAEAAASLRAGRIIRPDGVKRDLVFAFPGQGAQHPGMAHRLYETEPDFQAHCDEAFELLHPMLDRDLRDLWLTADDPAVLSETSVAQPLIYLVEVALARTLMGWGIRPARLIGHSVGEVAAGTIAGVFSLADGLRAIAYRSRLMQEMARGKMLAVALPADAVTEHLGGDVAVGAVNGRRQTIISGPEDALTAIAERLTAEGHANTLLHTSHAFHSPMMEPAAAEFERMLADVPLSAPQIPVVSCATGAPMTDDEARSPRFWARQVTDPVHFAPAVAALTGIAPALTVEVGPGNTLSALMRANPDVRNTASVVLPTLAAADAGARGEAPLDATIGRLWTEGVPVDLVRRDAHSGAYRVPAPEYPYQRRRFWIERPGTHQPMRDNQLAVTPEPVTIEGEPVTEAPPAAISTPEPAAPQPAHQPTPDWSLGAYDWVRVRDGRPAVATGRVEDTVAVLVQPGDRSIATEVRGAFQRAGYRTVRAVTGAGRDALDPASDESWDDLLQRADLADRPAVVAYAVPLAAGLGVSPADVRDQLDRVYFDLVAGARAIGRNGRDRTEPVTLAVLLRHSVDVTGAEAVNPVSAMAHGLVRTIEQEYRGIRAVVVDVAPGTPGDALTAALADLSRPVAALRGDAVWAPVLRDAERNAVPGRPRLRRNGVYLITGGLGGLGLVAARTLADTGLEPRLVLLGRSGSPAVDTARGAEVAAALADLEDAGAEVLVLRCDVADRDSLAAAVDETQRRFGPVNGVLHSAGVPGGGLIERRPRESVEAVFGPKVHGALNLDDVFAGRGPLDFLMLFSSQASLSGMLGSADYAAANAFLNAFAQNRSRTGGWTVSVAWPGWSEVGMMKRSGDEMAALLSGRPAAAEEKPAPDTALEHRRTLDKDRDWELAEHRFDGNAVLPGTGSLEAVVTAARQLQLFGAEAAIELREAVFVAPVNGNEPIELSVVFTPMAGMYRFRLQSRPAGTERPWNHHVNGVVTAVDEAPPSVDLAELKSRFEPTPVPPFETWIEFGPRWDSVTGLWLGSGESVAELTLDSRFHDDLADHPLHAALLDRASMSVPPADGEVDADKQYLPFLYRRLTVFAPIPAQIVVHGRMSEANRGVRLIDLEIYDAKSGAMVVRVGSYTVREIDTEDFVKRLGEAPAVSAPPVQTVEKLAGSINRTVAATAKRSTATTAPGGLPLLSPRDGGNALLEILDGAYPPVILVNAPGDRLRVPGVPWAGEAPVPVPVVAPEPAPIPALVPVPVPAPVPQAAAAGAPEIVAVLRDLWSEALGIDEIAVDEDFFELGGNSLVAVQLSARVREKFSVELSAGALFDANTIERLAKEIAAAVAR
ncbi:SDR family NAD(P)-dependent oxidoreductase [Micromonospora sp. DT43]|uniref:type I polyketide synthase n=1 Tax=Micromonospora sp. DT43 TaxID=3393440 RepID=UPI003CE83CED